jgi:hypothetical protein
VLAYSDAVEEFRKPLLCLCYSDQAHEAKISRCHSRT